MEESPEEFVDSLVNVFREVRRVLRDDGEVQQLREARGNAAKQQQAMEMANQGADVIHKGSAVDLGISQRRYAHSRNLRKSWL